mgnify:CR=1 FL=1
MLIAIDVNKAATSQLKACFGVSFGIKFDHLETIDSHIGQEGNKMLLGHRVLHRDKMLILHGLDGHGVGLVRLLGLQGRQGDAAAAEGTFAHGMDHVSADRTDIELTPQHIG